MCKCIFVTLILFICGAIIEESNELMETAINQIANNIINTKGKLG